MDNIILDYLTYGLTLSEHNPVIKIKDIHDKKENYNVKIETNNKFLIKHIKDLDSKQEAKITVIQHEKKPDSFFGHFLINNTKDLTKEIKEFDVTLSRLKN